MLPYTSNIEDIICEYRGTECHRFLIYCMSKRPFYIVAYYIKRVKPFWTYSSVNAAGLQWLCHQREEDEEPLPAADCKASALFSSPFFMVQLQPNINEVNFLYSFYVHIFFRVNQAKKKYLKMYNLICSNWERRRGQLD